jgi:oligopeptide/dipeptide ABC transporter ATP-binding protein
VASPIATTEQTAASTTGALLQVRGLRTEFKTRRGVVHAVNGVELEVGAGELVGLVGETGCGKSVTARSIISLVTPPGRIVAGEVRFDGRDMRAARARELRRIRGTGVGFIPQNPWGALNPVLSIERQFRNVLRAHSGRVSRKKCWDTAIEMLERVGIQGPERVLRGYAHELSGGMAQRVVIALALVLNPRLVIADEPTTGLDVTIQRQILDLITELLHRDQRAMLLVTHDLGIVAQYCNRVIVMYAGKVVESGTVDQVMTAPAHPYTRALLGAIPRPGHELTTLRGRVPDLIEYPAGCPFRARCDFAMDTCAQVEPVLRPVHSAVNLACHLPEGVSAHVAGGA